MYKSIIIALFAIVFTGCSKAQNNMDPSALSATEFSAKLKNTANAQVVDVRTLGEYKKGHLQNAVNIDWNGEDFAEKAATLDPAKPIFVYCLSGPRSEAAASRLKQMGFNEIYEMKGGMMDWRSQNLPEIKSTAAGAGMSMQQYTEALKSDRLVLVDFYADWCAPCKKMEPYLNKIAAEMPEKVKIVRINADDNTELCKAMNVSALPVLKLYKNNEIIWESLGFVEEAEVRKQLLK
ncbi:MAG: thioredoxin domain-containing protein [Kaistella sp.]